MLKGACIASQSLSQKRVAVQSTSHQEVTIQVCVLCCFSEPCCLEHAYDAWNSTRHHETMKLKGVSKTHTAKTDEVSSFLLLFVF